MLLGPHVKGLLMPGERRLDSLFQDWRNWGQEVCRWIDSPRRSQQIFRISHEPGGWTLEVVMYGRCATARIRRQAESLGSQRPRRVICNACTCSPWMV